MRNTLFFLILVILSACSKKPQGDLIIHNAVIYTVDSAFSVKQSMVIKEGRILALGTDEEILNKYNTKEKINAEGKAVFPGFIDAHCHFYAYGKGLQEVDLTGTKTFDEVIKRVVDFSKSNKSEWIIGRGWDQNDWDEKEFPTKQKLDSLFPSIPVLLNRIDGHAALANSTALTRAGIKSPGKFTGGIIEGKLGKLTGVLIDNAVDSVTKAIPKITDEQIKNVLLAAQEKCFAVGLTTVDDAGLDKNIVEIINGLHKEKKLKMRVYAMLTPNKENTEHYLKTGPYKTERLNVRSFKFYADGALGSRGACLIKEYSDKPGHYGFLLSEPGYFKKSAKQMVEKGFQMNTHCIGDSADRVVLDIYAENLEGKNDKRWRIEHAQVVDKEDLDKYGAYNIIPSVQPTHATSDMYWAEERLGKERVKTAYAYKDLLKQNNMLALGTDFPVENINPIYTFYAAVVRKDHKDFPEGGFQIENALLREETIRGMTIWAAYSNFEEKEKGSLERGKFADFVILDKDLMKVSDKEILSSKVIATYINGEKVFGK